MRNVYVVVHPEATHHKDDIVGGWHDSELTPAGTADASAIAEALADRIPRGAVVEVYSSDLRRAHAVATKIGAALEVPVVSDPGLREKSYGEAEGRPQSCWTNGSSRRPPRAIAWDTTRAWRVRRPSVSSRPGSTPPSTARWPATRSTR